MSLPAIRSYEFGPFRLDATERLLYRDGKLVSLPPKALDTLLALAASGGRLLTKDELMRQVWPDSFVEQNSLNRNISALRKALGEEPSAPRYIETIPKRGYRFIAQVREVREARGATVDPSVPRSAHPLVEAVATDRGIKTIAVLPFKLLGADENDEFLGLGIADTLITRLSAVCRILVRPTSAVLKYHGSAQDAPAAGRELQVEAVVEGSVRRAGERLRVTVQLVNVTDRAPLWADKFDENFTDIFAVEDAISEKVAAALTVQLTGAERQRLTKRQTEDLTAYRLYHKGRYETNKHTPEGLRRGIEFFKQAIARDPRYSLAYVWLAGSYALLYIYNWLPPRESAPVARAMAERALELDETLADAHAMLATAMLYYDRDFEGAKRGFARALDLNPYSPTVLLCHAEYSRAQGRFDEALAALRRALDLDPLSPFTYSGIGNVHYLARRYDQAIDSYRKSLEIDPHLLPAHTWLGLAYAQKGKWDDAITAVRRALAASGGHSIQLASLGSVYAMSGDTDEARSIWEQLQDPSAQAEASPFRMALLAASLGEKDHAFAWLEQAYRDRTALLLSLGHEPQLDRLRSDARFAELSLRVGLAR